MSFDMKKYIKSQLIQIFTIGDLWDALVGFDQVSVFFDFSHLLDYDYRITKNH